MSCSINVAEIYVLGRPSHIYRNLINNTSQSHEPKEVDHIIQFIDYMTDRSLKNNTFSIFLISAHGSMINGEYKLKIIGEHNLIVNADIISNKIKECQKRGLRCFGLIEACYSGNFDTTGFEICITASDSNNRACYGILQEGLENILKKSIFTPNEIYNIVTDQKSPIVIRRSCWEGCDLFTSQIFGDSLDIQLINPICIKELINIKIKGTTEEFTDILNKNKTTIGEFNILQVYSLLELIFKKPCLIHKT